jgi:hypothetical protein
MTHIHIYNIHTYIHIYIHIYTHTHTHRVWRKLQVDEDFVTVFFF